MTKHAQDAQLTDSERFHLLAGEAIQSWAHLEHTLWIVAASLLRVDQFRARIVMASLSNGRAQRDLLDKLAMTYLDEELASELHKKLKRMSSLSRERNLLAHAPILVSDDGRKNSVSVDDFDFDSKIGLVFSRSDFPPNRAKMLRDAARRLEAELMELWTKMQGRVYAAPTHHRGDPAFDPDHAAFRPFS